MNNKIKIISAFPGLGKSYLTNKLKNKYFISDSDSSYFAWTNINNNKVRNPNFINDYTTHIKNIILNYKNNDFKNKLNKKLIIFVSTHIEVIEAICKEKNLLKYYYLVFPFNNEESKLFLLNRYSSRNNSKEFINNINKNYDNWISNLEQLKCLDENKKIQSNNLEDVFYKILNYKD